MLPRKGSLSEQRELYKELHQAYEHVPPEPLSQADIGQCQALRLHFPDTELHHESILSSALYVIRSSKKRSDVIINSPEVPAAKSSRSTKAHSKPRVAASKATPLPTHPPPITNTSKNFSFKFFIW